MGEEKFTCPKCGALIPKGHVFCPNCGTVLTEVPAAEVPSPIWPEHETEQSYERKLSLFQRFYKLLTSPSEAMEDIGLAPDYAGVAVIILIEIVLSILSVAVALMKIQYIGTRGEAVTSFVYSAVTIGSILGVGLIVIRWLVKSYIIKYVCDAGSSWDFETAASVTGYAYLPSVVLGVIGLCVGWFLIPSLTVDTSNLNAAMQAVNEFRAQASWLILVYSLPMSFIGVIWTSCLGGLGAHFGTNKKCLLRGGVLWFFILGLIGVFLSFIGLLL
jgi:hypothetical protein